MVFQVPPVSPVLLFSLANGFLGVYDPPAAFIETILQSNSVNTTTSASTAPSSRKRRSLLALPSSSPNLNGVQNPTICLKFNEVLMFTVTNDFFPQYDDGNLYNTNPDFDFGAFKNLAERHQLMGTNSTLFPFRFEKAGVYVFKLNSAGDLKMVGKGFRKTFYYWSLFTYVYLNVTLIFKKTHLQR